MNIAKLSTQELNFIEWSLHSFITGAEDPLLERAEELKRNIHKNRADFWGLTRRDIDTLLHVLRWVKRKLHEEVLIEAAAGLIKTLSL